MTDRVLRTLNRTVELTVFELLAALVVVQLLIQVGRSLVAA